jgi:hypothetical protein
VSLHADTSDGSRRTRPRLARTILEQPTPFLYPDDHAGLCRCCLWWCGGHLPPSPWALLHIRVVTLGVVAKIPKLGRGRLDRQLL